MNKSFNYFLVGLIALGSFACQKKSDDDSTPSTPVTNVDLTGSYEGKITDSDGTFDLSIDIVKKSGNIYTASSGGSDIADLTVSGKKFTGQPVGFGDFQSLSGELNGNVLTFNGISTDGSAFNYSGTKVSGGGGPSGPTGGTGNGGGSDITIDGNTYTFAQSVCDFTTGFSMGSYYSGGGQSYATSTLNFDSAPTAGTYTVVFPGPAGPDQVTANVSYDITGYANGSSGSVTVTKNGGVYKASLDGVTFDRDAGGDPITEVSVSGTVTCE